MTGGKGPKPIGFYTDEEGRVRPITPRRGRRAYTPKLVTRKVGSLSITRSERSWRQDERKASKRVTEDPEKWSKHPERYDMPGVDMPPEAERKYLEGKRRKEEEGREKAAAEKPRKEFLARYSEPRKREYLITHYANDEGSLVELVTDERFRDLTWTEKPSSSETYIYMTPQALKALEGRVIMQERWVGDRLVERKYYTVKDGNVVELSHERKKDLRGFYDEVRVDGKTYKVYKDVWKVVEATGKPQVIVEKVGDKWWVSGQTYQLKDELKKRGGRWGGTAWIFENEPELADIAEVIQK